MNNNNNNTGDLMSHNGKLSIHGDSEKEIKYFSHPASDT
jgi:hypothetical protein